MTKADLMDNFDDITADRRVTRGLCEAHLEQDTGPGYLLGEYSVVASGGSSGQRGVFVYGWEAWAICYASIVRFQHRDWASDPALAGEERVTAVIAGRRRPGAGLAGGAASRPCPARWRYVWSGIRERS